MDTRITEQRARDGYALSRIGDDGSISHGLAEARAWELTEVWVRLRPLVLCWTSSDEPDICRLGTVEDVAATLRERAQYEDAHEYDFTVLVPENGTAGRLVEVPIQTEPGVWDQNGYRVTGFTMTFPDGTTSQAFYITTDS